MTSAVWPPHRTLKNPTQPAKKHLSLRLFESRFKNSHNHSEINIRGISSQFTYWHQVPLTNNHGKNIRSGDLDQYRMFAGNQAVHSGTLGGNSTHFYNSQQHTLNNLAPEYDKPSWVSSCTPFGQLQNTCRRTANSLPSRSSMNSPSLGLGSSTRLSSAAEQRQLIAQNAMPSQTLGSNLFSQSKAASQVSWVGTGSAGIDDPFPKRLGVEFNGRNSLQAAQRHISPMGTSLQTSEREGIKSGRMHVMNSWESDDIEGAGIGRLIMVLLLAGPVASHFTWKGPDTAAKLSGRMCFLCKRHLALTSGHVYQPAVSPRLAVLRCGHIFHYQCLQNITPNDQPKDHPPCIPCSIGEN